KDVWVGNNKGTRIHEAYNNILKVKDNGNVAQKKVNIIFTIKTGCCLIREIILSNIISSFIQILLYQK
ncbi:MAG: hypothetical protein IJA72_00165, partial [Clostridia bacterium]|nr:hypothetical protein [Clostridia bacterium]